MAVEVFQGHAVDFMGNFTADFLCEALRYRRHYKVGDIAKNCVTAVKHYQNYTEIRYFL